MQTLCIMSEIYSKGLQKEVPLDQHTVERIFPVLDDLLDLHDQLLQRLFAREKESQLEAGGSEGNFIINRIGDILVSQFSESNGDCMKKVYGKFCSRHNEAINVYKDLMNKNKNFKNFIKKMRSSSTVRRLDIPDCILLVTQRITKYPVLIQRILLHTKELMQTELHYMQTLCIMSEIYSKGLQKEVPLDQHTVERIFPVLDDLLDLHDQLLQRLFAREKESQLEAGGSEGNFIIKRIGDILVSQFSESNGDCMKKVYGKFCSRHNEK
ncbi:rho guanine nucleotide exchange factor 28-like [Cyprinodon tularosa]|uniref:rho guanine nucleotide exchange factor 28-like n=1 Tax=Cyprinodon tularosa TaxID=77115 RepID=UPI0018E1E7BF|nr:rho guanine nucleotide exchange factor 28-like [Cyprinodon tularosa]